MNNDFYQTLGVRRDADQKDIKAAYRRLARTCHPDVNPNDKRAETKFKEISEAYSVLSDPEKRKLYDQFGSNWENAANFSGESGPFTTTDFSGNGFESIFEQFFGQGRSNSGTIFDAYAEQMPRDVEKEIEVDLQEIDKGSRRTLTYQTIDYHGSRGGVATMPSTKKVEITIPAGIPDGKKLRVPGRGAAGKNGKAGDLYVTVRWAKHPDFKPNGEHLETEVTVPYWRAALGGEIKVPTLRTSMSMKIPPGSQHGQLFRLKGQGLTKYNGGRSDLFARLKISVPKRLSERERSLLEQLSKLASETA